MTSQKYLVGMVFIVLLIWGPIDNSWPAWLVIRIGYLILIPIIAWFLLNWIWRIWQPNLKTEDRLIRALLSATSGALFVLAIFELLSDTHIGNTMWIQTREGREAVGNDIILQGPDWGAVIILFILFALTFWYSISKREDCRVKINEYTEVDFIITCVLVGLSNCLVYFQFIAQVV